MILQYKTEGVELFYTVPLTTRDVLDWTVWIRCMADVEAQTWAALQWAAQWTVDYDQIGLGELLGTDLTAVVALCEHIATSAGLPLPLLEQMARLLDEQNEIPADWKPKSACTCLSCRRGVNSDQPCKFDAFDVRVVPALARVADASDHTAPLYVNQVRAIQNQAEARRLRYDREQREAQQHSKQKLADAFKRVNG